MIQTPLTSSSLVEPVPTIVLPEVGLTGLLLAGLILSLWATSLIALLVSDGPLSLWWAIPAILWQTFLYTGLFITAHDAMHGAVYTQAPRLNYWIGASAVFFYALFSYQKLLRSHWLHHHSPATELDPDFHDGKHAHWLSWYLHFMGRYSSWKQLLGFTVLYQGLHWLGQISHMHLILFWVVPSILSSLQLFYFGTYLPHREPKTGYCEPHRAESIALPVWLSFLACYHFGYHREHHEQPHAPWWQLPGLYQWNQARGSTGW